MSDKQRTLNNRSEPEEIVKKSIPGVKLYKACGCENDERTKIPIGENIDIIRKK